MISTLDKIFSIDILKYFSFFPRNRIGHFMQIVSNRDNLHGMSNPIFWEKQEKYHQYADFAKSVVITCINSRSSRSKQHA